MCPSCGASYSTVPRYRRPVGERLMEAASRTMTAADVCVRHWPIQTCPVTGLRWAKGALLLVYGEPGAGKSHLALKMAGEWGGRVAVLALEMGIGRGLADLLHRCGLSRRTDVEVLAHADAEELGAAARRGAHLVIDSVSVTVFTPTDLRALADAGAASVLAVCQSNKTGGHMGAQGFAHEADIVVNVSAGNWKLEKSRFEALGATGVVPCLSVAEEKNHVAV